MPHGDVSVDRDDGAQVALPAGRVVRGLHQRVAVDVPGVVAEASADVNVGDEGWIIHGPYGPQVPTGRSSRTGRRNSSRLKRFSDPLCNKGLSGSAGHDDLTTRVVREPVHGGLDGRLLVESGLEGCEVCRNQPWALRRPAHGSDSLSWPRHDGAKSGERRNT